MIFLVFDQQFQLHPDLKGNLTEYEINGKEYDLDNRIVKVEVDNDDVEKHRRLVGVLDRSEATCPVGVSRLVEPAHIIKGQTKYEYGNL